MSSKMKNVFGSGFAISWVLILVLAGTALLARQYLFVDSSPTLQEVLAKEDLRPSTDFSLVIAAVLAFALAALSIAKTYEIFRRSRPVAAVLIPEEAEDIPAGVVGNKAGELREEEEGLAIENAELRSRLKRIEASLREAEQVEQMLRKSNISLSKECERLKSENEARALKRMALKTRKKAARPRKRKTRK